MFTSAREKWSLFELETFSFGVQENVELMTKRRVPLENRDEETSLSDVQQVGVPFLFLTMFVRCCC